jgi:hypothetical protein
MLKASPNPPNPPAVDLSAHAIVVTPVRLGRRARVLPPPEREPAIALRPAPGYALGSASETGS